MIIESIREYKTDEPVLSKVAYTPSSDLITVRSPLSFIVKGKTTVNGVVFDSGTYKIKDIQELAMSVVDGYLMFNGFTEVKTIDDVPQQIPLPDPQEQEPEDYRSIIAIFEKWAHSRGLTQDIQKPENVTIDDLLVEEDYDMDLQIDDFGLLEDDVFPDPEGQIEEAVQEAVVEVAEEETPTIEEPAS